LLWVLGVQHAIAEMNASELARLREKMKQAEEQEAKEVEKLYSTKPVRFRMVGQQYVVPANYFTYKGRDELDTGDSQGFGFFLFLPDFGGYTKDNWSDRFDHRLIHILEIKPVDKNAMIPFSLGGYVKAEPANYGDPRSRFLNIRPLLEDQPSLRLYGLEGYRRKGAVSATSPVVWTGMRSNGEFFFFESSMPPEGSAESARDPDNPLCKTQYYSAQEDLFISYFYSQNHIAKWREIDDAIWAKIHGWRMK